MKSICVGESPATRKWKARSRPSAWRRFITVGLISSACVTIETALRKVGAKLAKTAEQVGEDVWRKREDGAPLTKAFTLTHYAGAKRAFRTHGGQLNADPPERHRHER